MGSLIFILLGVLLVPLFVASWRMSLAALCAQGFLMASIAVGMSHGLGHHDWLKLFDLAIVRGVCAPAVLGVVLRARREPARNNLIPPNVLWWTVALGSTLAAFNFAETLVPEHGDPQHLVAVATTGVLTGFLILVTQPGVLSQMIGVLHLENAIALLELGGKGHDPGTGVQLAQTAVLLVTLVLFHRYLASREDQGAAPPVDPEERNR